MKDVQEHYRKLLYEIKYKIVLNQRLSESEKLSQIEELLKNECPHGPDWSTK